MPSLAPARRDDQVAGERDLEAAGDGEALDRGDDRLARRALDDAGEAAALDVRALALDEGLQVHAGAEALAGAGEDRHLQVVVGVEAVERGGDAGGQRGVDRVARVGTVERDQEHAAVGLGENCLLCHAGRQPTARRRPRGPRAASRPRRRARAGP